MWGFWGLGNISANFQQKKSKAAALNALHMKMWPDYDINQIFLRKTRKFTWKFGWKTESVSLSVPWGPTQNHPVLWASRQSHYKNPRWALAASQDSGMPLFWYQPWNSSHVPPAQPDTNNEETRWVWGKTSVFGKRLSFLLWLQFSSESVGSEQKLPEFIGIFIFSIFQRNCPSQYKFLSPN